eukprot:7478110-Pyramimonas_sp.AAC.1
MSPLFGRGRRGGADGRRRASGGGDDHTLAPLVAVLTALAPAPTSAPLPSAAGSSPPTHA